jgi:hypothetical protein
VNETKSDLQERLQPPGNRGFGASEVAGSRHVSEATSIDVSEAPTGDQAATQFHWRIFVGELSLLKISSTDQRIL